MESILHANSVSRTHTTHGRVECPNVLSATPDECDRGDSAPGSVRAEGLGVRRNSKAGQLRLQLLGFGPDISRKSCIHPFRPTTFKRTRVYHPDREPAGYWDQLQRRRPELLVDHEGNAYSAAMARGWRTRLGGTRQCHSWKRQSSDDSARPVSRGAGKGNCGDGRHDIRSSVGGCTIGCAADNASMRWVSYRTPFGWKHGWSAKYTRFLKCRDRGRSRCGGY